MADLSQVPALRIVANDPITAGRRAPSNVEIEQALLGAMLVNNGAFDRTCDIVKADHFYDPVHGRIYEAIATLVGLIAQITPWKGQDVAIKALGLLASSAIWMAPIGRGIFLDHATGLVVGETSVFGTPLPVAGIAVDQQAALLAEGCLAAGDAKCTYGTGAFLLIHCLRL